MRLHELMKAVCSLGPSQLVLLNPIDEESQRFVEQSIGTTVTMMKPGVVPRLTAAFVWLRRPSLPWVVARADRQRVAGRLEEILDQFAPDIIWTTSVLCWVALPPPWRRRVVFDLIDGLASADWMMARLSIRRWSRRAMWWARGQPMRNSPRPPRVLDLVKAIDGGIRGRSLERAIGRTALALVVSHAENKRYAAMTMVPNGFDPATAHHDRDRFSECRFIFPANFRYAPNLDGAEWFVQSILPKLKQMIDSPRVIFAGAKKEGLDMYGESGGVQVIGPFRDLDDLVDEKSVVVVPLRSGTGTRLKILEAWSKGIPVVSTTIGAEGLGAVDRVNLLLADTPSAFAAACVELTRSSVLRNTLRNGGLETANRFRWEAIGDELRSTIRGLV